MANCNPFTRGHRYLLEQALSGCDFLHLFILSDGRSLFSAEERYEMVRQGIRGLDRIILHRTQDYMISAATFPTYFFKEKMQGQQANCKLDLELFGSKIAPELGITKRFVGSEPSCKVTKGYNEAMQALLPSYGIEVAEIERKQERDIPISASDVRKFLDTKEFDKIKALVPETVYAYLKAWDQGEKKACLEWIADRAI